MKDRYDKLKIWSDVFNTNKVIMLTGLSLLASGGINLTQMIYGEEKDIELASAIEQTAIVSEHLGKYVPKPKTITVKSNCGGCRTMWLDDIKKVNERIDEWHGR